MHSSSSCCSLLPFTTKVGFKYSFKEPKNRDVRCLFPLSTTMSKYLRIFLTNELDHLIKLRYSSLKFKIIKLVRQNKRMMTLISTEKPKLAKPMQTEINMNADK